MKQGTVRMVLAACAAAVISVGASAGTPKASIAETAQAAGGFETLLQAVATAGLAETLSSPGSYTVFAPTDAAFAKLPEGTVEQLLANPEQLKAVLLYHVVPGVVPAASVVTLDSAATLQGQSVQIDTTDGVKIDGATVTATDIACTNGMIHVIDTVLLPKDLVDVAAGAGSFDTLVSAVQAAGLVDTLKGAGPFTILAPTDAAFAKLPEGTVTDLLKPENKDKLVTILSYHVIPGNFLAADVIGLDSAPTVQGDSIAIDVAYDAAGAVSSVKVNEAQVVQTDVLATNGVIHVIDSVLLP